MERWNGRVALVTGASYGIGPVICRALVKHGMIVVGCARTVYHIETLASDEEVLKGPGKVHAIRCDLTKESEILEMFKEIREEFGRVDVCINNAGSSTPSPFDSGHTKDWKEMLEVNVLALCICTRESLALMKEKNVEDGQIIHMGRLPINPNDRLRPSLGVYNGSKFMVRALAEALRQELKASSSRIKVATISPGAVETDKMFQTIGSEVSTATLATDDKDLRREEIAERCLKSKDIADAVTFILSSPPHTNVEDVIVQPIDFPI